MTTFIEYNKQQKQAIAQLRRAFTKCKKVGLGWHNAYGTLEFYPSDMVTHIDDTVGDDSIFEQDIHFEMVNLDACEWSDDNHWAHFTKKGMKKYVSDSDGE